MSVFVQRLSYGTHLTVHHPARCHHRRTGVDLGERGRGIELERGVVVHRTVVTQDATVSVTGVLVQTEVGHNHHLVTEGVTQGAECHLGDTVGIPGARTSIVLRLGDPKEDDCIHSRLLERLYLIDERAHRVLKVTRQ